MLRYAVFLIFIIVGFLLSQHRKLYPIVAVVYGIALFYYTFLSRMELATTTEAVVATSTPVQQHWWVNAAYEIFRMKTSSYREAFILNIMLVFCKHFLEKVADKNGECCISKTEIVAGTFQTEDFRLLKHAGIHR